MLKTQTHDHRNAAHMLCIEAQTFDFFDLRTQTHDCGNRTYLTYTLQPLTYTLQPLTYIDAKTVVFFVSEAWRHERLLSFELFFEELKLGTNISFRTQKWPFCKVQRWTCLASVLAWWTENWTSPVRVPPNYLPSPNRHHNQCDQMVC